MYSIPGIQSFFAIDEVPLVNECPSISLTVICKPAIHCKSPENPFTSQFPPWQDIAHYRDRIPVPHLSQSISKPPEELLTPYLIKVISSRVKENNVFGLPSR
ncbi:hypothetical protein E2C01_088243 [Portunus trituberculatus]|uniref:Uncharacterized protein n=1 Tax=Portunus trituberculatus TaxID=210409 RepID=A0A5B7J5L7_PORTR|nr:hypothetical protein [Portunus trituberculatus]